MGAYYVPSPLEISLLKQHTKNIHLKVELLNHDFTLQDSLEGNLVSDTLNIESDSKQRRSYSCNLCVTDSTFLVGADKKVWINKYIRVYYGIEPSNVKQLIAQYSHKADALRAKASKASTTDEERVKLSEQILKLDNDVIRLERIGDCYWWLIGTFTYLNASYTYSGTDNSLSLQCADMMADFDGTKNGQITVERKPDFATIETYNSSTALKFVVYAVDPQTGEPNKMIDMIEALCNEAGIENYRIQEYPDSGARDYVPYDLEFTDAVTYCDVWTQICDLYPGWEFFFDVDGTFIWRRIPSGGSGEDNEMVMLDNDVLDEIYVDESKSYDFSTIYNITEIWGESLDLSNNDRYVRTMSTYDEERNMYTVRLDLVAKNSAITDPSHAEWSNILTYFSHGDKLAIRINKENKQGRDDETGEDEPTLLRIIGRVVGVDNDTPEGAPSSVTLGPFRIVDYKGRNIETKKFTEEEEASIYCLTYITKYVRDSDVIVNSFRLDGQTQCFGKYEEKNAECPFSTTALGYSITKRLNKEKLYSDDLCWEWARYETYVSTQMRDTITLKTLIIPWIDVNQKIRYLSQYVDNREEKLHDKENIPEYIIKNVSWSTYDGTMTMTLYRFVPDLEFVIDTLR